MGAPPALSLQFALSSRIPVATFCDVARAPRVEFPGAIYHVIARGAARQQIYRDRWDRQRFLATLGCAVQRYGWLCHAYCLMTTHYHLLLQTPTANLSAGMHKLNGAYAQAFNRRHALPGHVFEGRYRALLVDREAHLLELARYIVLNPVRGGICGAPGSWPWSSYRATAGLARVPEFLTVDWTLAQCGVDARQAQASYRRFVLDGHVQGPGPRTCPAATAATLPGSGSPSRGLRGWPRGRDRRT